MPFDQWALVASIIALGWWLVVRLSNDGRPAR